MKSTDTTPLSELRVAKTLAPWRDGAKRFTRRYGDELVCVRHRLSQDGNTRYTTVELLVESTPVIPRNKATIAIRLPYTDQKTRSLLKACGGKWDPDHRCWHVHAHIAKQLNLQSYRTEKPTPR